MTYKAQYLQIELQEGGAAMDNHRAEETARILRGLANQIALDDRWPDHKYLWDTNGNQIGFARIITRRV